jgi:hypothetical protein
VNAEQRRPFIPRWIPAEVRRRLDLGELAADEGDVGDEAERLGARFHAFVAAYRAGARGRPHGLCSVYKYARLSGDAVGEIKGAEEQRPGIVFVAYRRPLERYHRSEE